MKNRYSKGTDDRILDAAFHLFLEQGYEATGIRAICSAAGVELPSLYYYFGSKRGLFLTLADRLRQPYDPAALRYDSSRSEEAIDYLRVFFLFSVRYAISHLPETRFFLRYALFPPEELKREIEAYLEKIHLAKDEMIRPAMQACIRQGIVKSPIDQAMATYWKFINNNTFDIVFFREVPQYEELMHLWSTFLRCRLSIEHDT